MALDLREGPLYLALDNLRHLSRDRLIPASMRESLEKLLENFGKELKLTQEVLAAVEDSFHGKLRYNFWRGSGSKHQLEKQSTTLQKSCVQLREKCTLLHEQRTGYSSYLWPADVFKVIHETVDNNPICALPSSDIFVARGNYVSGNTRVDGDFVLENKRWENDARLLCQRLSRESLKGVDGILPVMGYRQPPYNETDGSSSFQLIIQLPQGRSWRSLERMIVTQTQPWLLARLEMPQDGNRC